MRSDRTEIIAALHEAVSDSRTPLWFPGLSDSLTRLGWKNLNRRFGIGRENYGTNRVIRGSEHAGRAVTLSIYQNGIGGNPDSVILVEELSAESWRRTNKEARPYPIDEFIGSAGANILREAFDVLGKVKSLSGTVFTLVRMLHILRSDYACEYDISFSEPYLPFSIFVSVPHNRCYADALRVAESIVHEAMHLQLTLIDEIIPLVQENSEEFYSPWREEYRPLYGVLHGLYVFGVLREFYSWLARRQLADVPREFVVRRFETISSQIEGIVGLETSPALTQFGRGLLRRARTLQEIHRENPLPLN